MDSGPSPGTNPNQTPNAADMVHGSETVGDKVHSREGNSPDRRLRSLNLAKWEKRCHCKDIQEVGLEAAIP
jgi:hypothetical protein